jgi:hypothetical protein
MKHILKNWKTSLAGLISIITAGLVGTGKIDATTAATIVTITSGLGFAAAKDGNVTGTPQ